MTGIELLPVRATSRTVWLIVRLRTDGGLEGLGEASDAFGFANTTAEDTARMRAQLAAFFNLIDGRSPFEIESYRQRGEAMARQGLVAATAFSAIEQALWDLAGKALDVPSHVLLGGKVRNTLPVYANINRATSPRTPDGFAAAAKRAVADGFRAIKAAPWDGFPPPSLPLSTAQQIAAYQNARIDAGRAPKTVNGELSVLRQVLRHARLWYRFQEDYRALKNTKPPVGQALTDDEQKRLFEAARSKPEWIFAYVASTLAFYCGLRACEIRGLQWKHVDWDTARIQIRRSKTPAGWRDPSLNDACARALKELNSRAKTVGFNDPEHYLFPWHGRDKKIDPSRPMTTWRSAWRSLRKAAGLDHVRFHDGRHTALTRLAEKGQPDWVIQAQMGHVSPAMMRTYSHIRRKALDEAAAALEPAFKLVFPRHKPNKPTSHERCDTVMSQFTSQWDDLKKEIRRNANVLFER